MVQTYDIAASYRANYDAGPQFSDPPPEIPETPLKTFLGIPVRSRIGIAAGLLLNSKWITGYARHGFDILTYKTVRSAYRPCYEKPNWVFVDGDGSSEGPVYAITEPPADPIQITSAVCFGMPSMDPTEWRADIARAKSELNHGQVLIVSVVATPGKTATVIDVAADFARCAHWATEAGADVIEANFSCPNVCTPEGTIYQDPRLSRSIAEQIRAKIGTAKLLLKVGHFRTKPGLEEFLIQMNGVVDGITLVNGISRPVLHRDGTPVFGEDYVKAGVLGRAIHEPSVANVRDAGGIIAAHSLNLEIVAVGGISKNEDMADFFDAGAGAVLMGSSPMYLPRLAVDAKLAHPNW
ncbi:MAG: dihydroorotate dehydrogenase (NAD+) catalytic subunit [Limisphaerales bacterium]|jgi:dihydroorotate dehydrogenase (NAD+) catalytic subunit